MILQVQVPYELRAVRRIQEAQVVCLGGLCTCWHREGGFVTVRVKHGYKNSVHHASECSMQTSQPYCFQMDLVS
jgi:hypothetical protein